MQRAHARRQARTYVAIHFEDMSEESGDGQPVRTVGSLSASLRDQSDRVWEGLHAHPFLRELSRGVLPLEKFRFFIE